MNSEAQQLREGSARRMRKLERVLAWTMSGISVVITSCYFTLVGLQWPALDQPVFGTPLSLGAALGLACLFSFLVMIVIFTFLSDKIDRDDREGPSRPEASGTETSSPGKSSP